MVGDSGEEAVRDIFHAHLFGEDDEMALAELWRRKKTFSFIIAA